MKITGISIILLILAGVLIVPVGTSYATYADSPAFNPTLRTEDNQTNSNMTVSSSENQTNSNMTMPETSTTGMTGSTNSTGVTGNTGSAGLIGNTGSTGNMNMTNQTITTGSSPSVTTVNDTTAAQAISDFIHQSVVDFNKQKTETRTVMLDCRDKIQSSTPSELDKIRAGCTTQLSAIKEKYQDERNHFHDLISKYRQSVIVFLNDARKVQVSKADMAKALSDLITQMHMEAAASSGLTGPVTGLMAKTNNTNCVNPPGGPAIC